MSNNNEEETLYERVEHSRLETFCDGVIAIAITLLVLEMKVPQIHGHHITKISFIKDLLAEWPIYVSTVISFFMIGSFWMGHHRHMKALKYVDHYYMLITLLWLLGICLIPYASQLLSEYILNPSLVHIVTPIYVGINAYVASLVMWQWTYANKKNLIKDHIDLAKATRYNPNSKRLGIKLFWLGTFLSSFFIPYVSLVCIMIIVVIYLFPKKTKA